MSQGVWVAPRSWKRQGTSLSFQKEHSPASTLTVAHRLLTSQTVRATAPSRCLKAYDCGNLFGADEETQRRGRTHPRRQATARLPWGLSGRLDLGLPPPDGNLSISIS